MPDYVPPFTVYWSTFTNASPDSAIDRQHLWDNVEAIYNIISHSRLTITDAAIYGIIAGSWAVGGLNPARSRKNYLVVDPEAPIIRNGYGLWMDSINDESPHGFQQTERLITNIMHSQHYSAYSDPFAIPSINTPSLTQYLRSHDNASLAWYWVLNYTLYRYERLSQFLSADYQEFCADSYDAVRKYITTYPRKINPAAVALFKKKKRWWK